MSEATETKKDKRYGSSSYHYWHNHGKERAESGDTAPMVVPRLVAVEERQEKVRSVKKLSKYSWTDGKKIVSIYIDFPGIGAKEADVTLECKKRSFLLTIRDEPSDHELRLIRLNQKIVGEKSTLRFKENQLVIKLAKDDVETKWYDLFKTTARGVTGSDSDE
eukprot:TRINITY_DN34634_c0_g1_i1.p1 TRINITY_DN34634_c0_g1~~TRINITY_DN34634_c0_g1_i1.p1  ORF type:complete len:179 (+),score=43.94 TRINITY_DN34634_c0_g1_i1:50-538(+)